MLNAQVNGEVEEAHAVEVHVPAELSLYSYSTVPTPLPVSAAVEASVTEPAR